MTPVSRTALLPLLLALCLTACDPLRENPQRPTVVPEAPPPAPPALVVTLHPPASAYCSGGTVELRVTVEGGAADSLSVRETGWDLQPVDVTASGVYVLDCATAFERTHSFRASAELGTHTFESADVTVTVDRLQPSVVAQRPATRFPRLDAPIEFEFSEPLLRSSVEAGITELRDGAGFTVAHQASLSEDGKVLRLVPSAPLVPPVVLDASVQLGGLTDLAGNAIREVERFPEWEGRFTYWPFTLAGPAPSTGLVGWKAVTGGGSGPTYVAWTASHPPAHEIFVSRWSGSGWTALPPVPAPVTGSVACLTLELGPSLNPVVFWCEPTGDSFRNIVRAAAFDGTGWTELGTGLEVPSLAGLVRMRVTPEGMPVVAWGHDASVRFARWTGSAWELLDAPGPDAPYPSPLPPSVFDFKTSHNGGLLVAWTASVERTPGVSSPEVFVRTWSSGRWWPEAGFAVGSAPDSLGIAELVLTGNVHGSSRLAWIESLSGHDEAAVYVAKPVWTGAGGYMWSAPSLVQPRIHRSQLGRLVAWDDGLDRGGVAWQHLGASPFDSAMVSYRLWGPEGLKPTQLVGSGRLVGFHLDDHGLPWALIHTNTTSEDLAPVQPQ